MMRALYAGVAGLRTHQSRMDVIGNNIANVNTLAFKSSATTFQDIMYQTTSGASGPTETLGGKNANQVGLGVTTGATKVSIETGGAAEATGSATDLKLSDAQNTNFFIVSNGSENVFTRAGSFFVDKAGNLAMTTTGYMVQGWGVDPETKGIKKDTVAPLRVMSEKNMTSAPEPTTNGIVGGVLDKNTPVLQSEAGYIMNLNFYDSLGYSYSAKFSMHTVDKAEGIYSVSLTGITNSTGENVLDAANNEKGVTIKEDDIGKLFGKKTERKIPYNYDSSKFKKEAAGGVAAGKSISTVIPNKAGKLETFTSDGAVVQENNVYGLNFTSKGGEKKFFSLSEIYGVSEKALNAAKGREIDASGKLLITKDATDYTVKFNPADGSFSYVNEAGSKSATLNISQLGVNFKDISIDFSDIKCADNRAASTVSMDRGDKSRTLGVGKKLGKMTGLSVDQSGKIFGSYDNGNTVLLGQIAVAHFANASGLESIGNNCYATTLNSGDFDGIGVDVTADGGKISTNQLEMSNVDLAREFTTMITTQRGFQANSRIITVSDTLLEELVNLKR